MTDAVFLLFALNCLSAKSKCSHIAASTAHATATWGYAGTRCGLVIGATIGISIQYETPPVVLELRAACSLNRKNQPQNSFDTIAMIAQFPALQI
ncbi:hypothetical protein K469DRAFT_278311 [Zopfia rhizophila CBS 207.26]|uniref:Secreted protein n=1 Tax=Zopfia rhizophila CBS 207.26 TaxID=1314779 RepID=A0A6A6DLI7_9PEZI|nr:hypothetical protein K469DRAFT_278311 [Zopfia rhizophila CBS 207.26]